MERALFLKLVETVKALPLRDRVELVDVLWESIVGEGYEPPLNDAHVAELDRRVQAHERNPADVISWEQIKADAMARYYRGEP